MSLCPQKKNHSECEHPQQLVTRTGYNVVPLWQVRSKGTIIGEHLYPMATWPHSRKAAPAAPIGLQCWQQQSQQRRGTSGPTSKRWSASAERLHMRWWLTGSRLISIPGPCHCCLPTWGLQPLVLNPNPYDNLCQMSWGCIQQGKLFEWLAHFTLVACYQMTAPHNTSGWRAPVSCPN